MTIKEDVRCILDVDCSDCKVATGTGQLFSLCNTLKYSDCEQLRSKIMDESITPGELIRIMIERTKDDPKNRNIIYGIRELITS